MKASDLKHIFTRMPTLLTPRLILRPICEDDAEDMYEYSCLSSVTRYLLWEPHPDLAYTKCYLDTVREMQRRGEFTDWAVIWRESGKLIGTCGFTSFQPEHDRGEVGYVLNPAFWGMGIAVEAVMAVMEYGFTFLHLARIEAKYIYGNDASRRVMEKCHMQFEGILRHYMKIKGEYRDIGICAITSEDFVARFGSEGGHFATIKKERKLLWNFFD